MTLKTIFENDSFTTANVNTHTHTYCHTGLKKCVFIANSTCACTNDYISRKCGQAFCYFCCFAISLGSAQLFFKKTSALLFRTIVRITTMSATPPFAVAYPQAHRFSILTTLRRLEFLALDPLRPPKGSKAFTAGIVTPA